MRSLLVVDPAARLSAAAVLLNPWVAGGASSAPLGSVADQLKRFNTRRKFRGGVRKIMATNVRRPGWRRRMAWGHSADLSRPSLRAQIFARLGRTPRTDDGSADEGKEDWGGKEDGGGGAASSRGGAASSSARSAGGAGTGRKA